MGTKMTHAARAELTNAVRRRYGAATGAEKHKILDEFIAVTGYHEKSAIRALNAEPVAKCCRSSRIVAVGDGGRPPPPAQIRTCSLPAYGSYLECVARKRTSG
ncbi:MAG: hypothetical protein M0Z84_11935 [Gammaproteobacteria bacterium]|nr:hypothetical protein [Gammaproteobacteria bacterium]